MVIIFKACYLCKWQKATVGNGVQLFMIESVNTEICVIG
jgi:hypothetical protein